MGGAPPAASTSRSTSPRLRRRAAPRGLRGARAGGGVKVGPAGGLTLAAAPSLLGGAALRRRPAGWWRLRDRDRASAGGARGPPPDRAPRGGGLPLVGRGRRPPRAARAGAR